MRTATAKHCDTPIQYRHMPKAHTHTHSCIQGNTHSQPCEQGETLQKCLHFIYMYFMQDADVLCGYFSQLGFVFVCFVGGKH